MALYVSLDINDLTIGDLEIVNIGGPYDGECEYEVTLTGLEFSYQTAIFKHNRPDGALVCVQKAIAALQERSEDVLR